MSEIEKQVVYWRDGAAEDWPVACDLVQKGKRRHGLFFAHLTLEKALKALVCRRTQNLAPRIHNLVRLAALAALPLNPQQRLVLEEMNRHGKEGRYPEFLGQPPPQDEADDCIRRAKEVYQWLMSLLSESSGNTSKQ